MMKRIGLLLLSFSLITVFSAVTDCGCTYAHASSSQKTTDAHPSCHQPQSAPSTAQGDCCVNCQLEKATTGTETLNLVLYRSAIRTDRDPVLLSGAFQHPVSQDDIVKPTGPPYDVSGRLENRIHFSALYLTLKTLRI